MERYIALLRGINISGKNKIAMSELKAMIKNKFELDIPVFIISQKELEDILNNAPDWWSDNDKDIYDNLIFMFSPLSYSELVNEVGSPKDEFEKVHNYKNAILWSFSRKDYQKTNWWSKTARPNISNKITIRTANTVRKIVGI